MYNETETEKLELANVCHFHLLNDLNDETIIIIVVE